MEWIRDAPIGQMIRYITGNKVLLYPEERPDFECPHSYTDEPTKLPEPESMYVDPEDEKKAHKEEEENPTIIPEPSRRHSSATTDELEKIPTVPVNEQPHLEGIQTTRTQRSQIERVGSRTALQKSLTQRDLEQQLTLAMAEKGPSRPILPDTLEDGTILVDWYTTDDPSNPQNWTLGKKLLVTLIIW